MSFYMSEQEEEIIHHGYGIDVIGKDDECFKTKKR